MPGSNRVVVILCFKCCLPPGWLVVAGQACCPGHVVLKRSSYGLDVKCPQCLICLNISSPASSAVLGECEAFGKEGWLVLVRGGLVFADYSPACFQVLLSLLPNPPRCDKHSLMLLLPLVEAGAVTMPSSA